MNLENLNLKLILVKDGAKSFSNLLSVVSNMNNKYLRVEILFPIWQRQANLVLIYTLLSSVSLQFSSFLTWSINIKNKKLIMYKKPKKSTPKLYLIFTTVNMISMKYLFRNPSTINIQMKSWKKRIKSLRCTKKYNNLLICSTKTNDTYVHFLI